MTKSTSQLVVCLSGGMDSAPALPSPSATTVRKTLPPCTSVTVSAPKPREQTSFLGICEALGIHRRLIVKTPFFRAIGGSALTDTAIDVPDAPPAHRSGNSGYLRSLPQRAFSIRRRQLGRGVGAERIYIGAVQQDSSGYPDCRPEFYEAFNRTIVAGTREGRIQIETPLIALRKHEIVRRGLELGAPFHLTWSCYSREDQACGSCDSCVLRLRAFAAAGAVDPISYLSQTAVQEIS